MLDAATRGMDPAPGEGNHTHEGLYHSSFVKVLTNLTDLGPEDGGTGKHNPLALA